MPTSQPPRPERSATPLRIAAVDDGSDSLLGPIEVDPDDGIAHGGRQRRVPVPVVAHALVPRVRTSPGFRTTIRRVVVDPAHTSD